MIPGAIIALVVLGAAFGLGLAYASERFAVQSDPKVALVLEALPGTNCGGCGFASCAAYAEAIVLNGAAIGQCAPGGPDCAAAVSAVMGVEAPDVKVVRKAFLHCRGDREHAVELAAYAGVETCAAAAPVQGGGKACPYGCLGFGDCAVACPFDALRMGENGLPAVDPVKCTACGICVRACPRGLFELFSEDIPVLLACSSRDRGAKVKKACSVGCIGCRLCVKAAEGEAIAMDGSLPVVHYDKPGDLHAAAARCPMNCFVVLDEAATPAASGSPSR
jgi:RnfABCDGE-type electron transport complex B subunit